MLSHILPPACQEDHGQEGLERASGHGKDKPVLPAFLCIRKHRARHEAFGLRGSRGTRGHTQWGWNALPAAVPQLGLTSTEQRSSGEPAKCPTPV